MCAVIPFWKLAPLLLYLTQIGVSRCFFLIFQCFFSFYTLYFNKNNFPSIYSIHKNIHPNSYKITKKEPADLQALSSFYYSVTGSSANSSASSVSSNSSNSGSSNSSTTSSNTSSAFSSAIIASNCASTSSFTLR